MLEITNKSWKSFFENEKSKSYFHELTEIVEDEYVNQICFPSKKLIFNAFEKCNLEDLKVVIIGQDPYHGIGEAHGLAFSVQDGVAIPPSLKNIFIEIQNNYNSVFFPTSGNLEYWAKQGILLLNATLTVRKDSPNSHKHIPWQKFTDEAIKYISENKKGVVFLLWGAFAQKKKKYINTESHFVLESGHPSPLSANQGKWFGNQHFIKANEILKNKGYKEINWIDQE